MVDINFWNSLKKPIFTLSPMEDVTDTVFRETIIELSNPKYLNVVFSEFTSTDGLCHPLGSTKVRPRLFVNSSERKLLKEKNIKIVAQIWGKNPENYKRSIELIKNEMEFDGIDINMGCPVKKIIKQGSCSELIKNPSLAKEIIVASKEASDLPVSVKTRTGTNQHATEQWIAELLQTKPAAIILHARTQKMQSESPADWNEIGKAVNIRDGLQSETIIIGNGDIFSIDDAFSKIDKYNVDGVMIGRGILKNPWLFNIDLTKHSAIERIDVLWKHTYRFVKTWGTSKSFAIMKRFFKIYANNFIGAAELRSLLMNANNIEDVKQILESQGFNLNYGF